ncbi:MAG: permease [Ectothiorhodospiraceae bacterium]|nr:permease [Ectothiorhodospiraceae bacterium]
MTLWRYILKNILGPFLFANGVIIFLFLLQFLMKSASDIVGKGLSFWLISELIALNLAWMVVLAVPMSVLVATLMAFGKMAADNETVIMRASGMSLYRMMVPALGFAVVVTMGLVTFNNDVLPESNIRLRTLMSDILRKKPTLSIQAGVFTNETELPNYRILVRQTYEESNDLRGVTIYDLSDPQQQTVVLAEYGKVSFSSDYSKIFMDLTDGEIHQMESEDPTDYRKLRFERHRVAIPASGFGFQRSDATKARRDDRTSSAAMMQEMVDSIRDAREQKVDNLRNRLLAESRKYIANFVSVPAQGEGAEYMQPGYIPYSDAVAEDRLPEMKVDTVATDTADAAYAAIADLKRLKSFIESDAGTVKFDNNQINKYLVEIYKKYSIPFACIVFTLVGVPLGMMARRGGFGVGAGLSLGFFLFYWACLIGGEKLADRGVLSPLWGMWAANVVLGVLGIIITIRTARETMVIDWSKFSRLLPRRYRAKQPQSVANPHEAS